MENVKNSNFIVIQGWMVNKLGLKGNELLVYACIYGFSQTEGQTFNGSLQYLADWTNSTKQGVIKNLQSLISKGLIKKHENTINNVKFCSYESLIVLNKVEQGIKQSLTGGIKQSLPNNINTNNIDNNIERKIYKKEKKQIIPSSLDEVIEYARERGREELAKDFYEFYSASNWIDYYGNKILNWKQKFITYENKHPAQNKPKFELTESEKAYSKKLKERQAQDQAEIEVYDEAFYESFRQMGYTEEQIQKLKELK